MILTLPLGNLALSIVSFSEDSNAPAERNHSAVWFKVDELWKTDDGSWAATDVLSAQDSVWTFTIPAKLKAGQYIIRHEM